MQASLRSAALYSAVALVRLALGFYDTLSYPVFLLWYRPWTFRKLRDRQRAKVVQR